MTFIAINDLETNIDEPIVPKRLGLCSNFIGAVEVCSKAVFDNDIEAVELPMKNNRRQFICGPCVSRLLDPKPVILESEKPEKGKSHKHGRTGARLSTGPESRKMAARTK